MFAVVEEAVGLEEGPDRAVILSSCGILRDSTLSFYEGRGDSTLSSYESPRDITLSYEHPKGSALSITLKGREEFVDK